MTVTWTAITNPPAAGNITLADDTEVDGSEGVVSHAGGYIQAITYTTDQWYLNILEDAELDQAGGNVRLEVGSRFYMQPGGKLTFSGSDNTYQLDLGNHGRLKTNGTSAKHCVIGGIDITHRMLYIDATSAATVNCYYTDFKFCSSAYSWYIIGPTPFAYFYGCEFIAGTAAALITYWTITGIILENCILGDASCTQALGDSRFAELFLINCTINQSNATSCFSSQYKGTVYYTPITWTNITPATVMDVTPIYGDIYAVELFLLSVNEGNSLSDCDFCVQHENYADMMDSRNITNLDVPMQALTNNLTQLCNALNRVRKTVAGVATVWVPCRMYFENYKLGVNAWHDISKSGGVWAYNGQYNLTLAKEGYRTQTTTLWGSSDQTWNVTLVAQADLDDIVTHLTDIKGTGFVKDTDSLVNLAHTGADGDTLETLSDQIDLVATQASVDVIDGIVDDILVDTGTTLDGLIGAIKTKTDNLPADTSAEFNEVDAALVGIINALGLIWTDTTDILQDIVDMEGTGFVKDTDSLVNLAHTGADGDTLETLSDQVDLVATQTSVDVIDGIVDDILEDTETTLPATLTTVLTNISNVYVLLNTNYALLTNPTYGLSALKTLTDNLGDEVDVVKVILYNPLKIDETNSKLIVYETNGITPKYSWPLTSRLATAIILSGGGPVNRGAQTL